MPNIQNLNGMLNTLLIAGMAYAGFKLYQSLKVGAGATSEAVGGAIADVQMFLNGSHDIEATMAGVPLMSNSLDNPEPGVYIMSASRREAIAKMHQDNGVILQSIFDTYGRLKPAYIGFIDEKIVGLGDI